MQGITESDTEHVKRDKKFYDVETVNKHLFDVRVAALRPQDEVHTNSENVEIHSPKEYHSHICSIPWKQDDICSRQVNHINNNKHSIYLTPAARRFKSALYHAGPKERELEQLDINRQLKAGARTQSNAEWAARVLFAPKKDGKLQFCVDYWKPNKMPVKDSNPVHSMD